MKQVQLIRGGRIAYHDALTLQRTLAAARSGGTGPDCLIVLEHPPTITLGVRADPGHILVSSAELARRGVTVIASDRGGDVTYHAPGQLVGYPILKLAQHGADLGRYVRNLEETIIRVLADYGLVGQRIPGLTGVWVNEGQAKICAIGVRLSAAGITSHGFALNVNPDLSGFAQIVPCGISDRSVTSLAEQLGTTAPTMAEVESRLLRHFADVFGIQLQSIETASA